jgi:hypothetical protein
LTILSTKSEGFSIKSAWAAFSIIATEEFFIFDRS